MKKLFTYYGRKKMTKDVAFKKGEKFIEFGNVYVVTKIEVRDYDGEKRE